MRSIILRILSGLICILLLLPLAVACGNSEQETTEQPDITLKLTLNDTELVLARGGSVTLSASVSPLEADSKAEPQSVTPAWSSSDTSIATVNEAGLVTAVGDGYAVISAQYDGAKDATCPVMVHSRHIRKTEFSLSEDGQSYTLTKYAPEDGVGGIVYTVPSVHEGLPVTAIGQEAFRECKSLSKVCIPSTVKTIGYHAFFGSSVTSVSLSEGLEQIDKEAFWGCSQLKEIDIPQSVDEIGAGAFEACGALERIGLPSGLKEIPDYMFSRCSAIKDISLPDSIISIGKSAFDSCFKLEAIHIPDGVTSIGEKAFSYCMLLEQVELPRGLTSIGAAAFDECDGLESLSVNKDNPVLHSNGNCIIETQSKTLLYAFGNFTIPNDGSITAIGERVFYDDETLTDIVLPLGLERIGNEAFALCGKLSSVTLPDSLTHIGDGAFYQCSSIRSFSIPKNVTYIGPRAFATFGVINTLEVDDGNSAYHSSENCIIKTATGELVSGCLTSVIPDDGSVSAIGEGAFMGVGRTSIILPASVKAVGKEAFAFSSVAHVSLPHELTRIEDSTFAECRYLASIQIPHNVSYVGEKAFAGCFALRSVTLPDRVTELKDYAFERCVSLDAIKLPPAVTELSENLFIGCNALKQLNIPREATVVDLSNLCIHNPTLNITIDAGNTTFRAVDGCIIDSSGTLIWAGQSKVIPENVGITAIGEYVFFERRDLESIVIPEGVTAINNSAFTCCYSLKSVTLPSTLVTIGEGAFKSCNALSCDISLPEGFTEIGERAFASCDELEYIALPSTLTRIGANAFYNCPSLKKLSFASPSGWSADDTPIDERYLSVPGFVMVLVRNFYPEAVWEKKN